MESTYDVVVVGGGPVGLACAMELGSRGLRCAVFERRVEGHQIPKGQNLTQRSLEHFARWGLGDELRARRILPPDHPIGGIVLYRDLASPYWHAPAGREALGRFFAESNERLPQYLMEAVLREHVARLPTVDAFFGRRVVDVDQDDRGVTVRLDDGAEVSGAYTVGCDGGGSVVRERAGIPFVGFGPQRTMALILFRSSELHERLDRLPTRTTYRVMHPDLGGYWRLFGRVDDRDSWFFHGPVAKGRELDRGRDGARLLAQAAGAPFACEVDHLARWEARTAIADRYREGRIFIAGDACHVHPPYGGFGLNSGLEDAVNLSWKLAAALHGWGEDSLLDSYGLERRPVFAETADEVINAWIEHDRVFLAGHSPEDDPAAFDAAWGAEMAISDTGPPWYEPHYEGSSLVEGPRTGRSGVFGEYSMRARPGHHFASRTLSDGSRSFDALGREFTLFAFGLGDEVTEQWSQAADTLGIPLTVVCDAWNGERREYGSRLVLVRPDRYVAWVGHEAGGDPRGVLARAVGRAACTQTAPAGAAA